MEVARLMTVKTVKNLKSLLGMPRYSDVIEMILVNSATRTNGSRTRRMQRTFWNMNLQYQVS